MILDFCFGGLDVMIMGGFVLEVEIVLGTLY